jgi:anaerobic selenocysteine-containing dehydrogenase
MSKELNRRTFLKIAAGASVATGLSAHARQVSLEPHVRPPEQELPGRATWYASTCRECPAGCGILVRVINGRPRKIEGNPNHPLNRGKLCARGQAGLQTLYDPDRLRSPVEQAAAPGNRYFSPLPWAEALERITARLGAQHDGSRIVFLTGQMPDHLYHLTSRFLEALGGGAPFIHDLHTTMEGRALSLQTTEEWLGVSEHPIYDLAQAEVIFSFGANFLETWMSPVAQAVDFGQMRQGQVGGRGHLVQFEPRLSSTGASADEWVPIKPGTEGYVALALGRIIVEENLGQVGLQRENAELYRNVDVAAMAEVSGISAMELDRLARVLASARRSISIPGGYLSGLTNGPRAAEAIMALNVILQRLGREGGVYLPQPVPTPAFSATPRPSTYAQMMGLIERMRQGEVDVLFIHGVNPAYELPPWTRFLAAMARVPLAVSFSPIIDETTAHADLILPDHTYLEGWGYKILNTGIDRPGVGSQQPVTAPLYETRSTADVILELAARLGAEVSSALPWEDEVAFLEEQSTQLLGASIGAFDAQSGPAFWSRWRQLGGWWAADPIRREPVVARSLTAPLQIDEPMFVGEDETYPFHLLPYESITLSDGRGANQPWLQETADPMTTARWGTWVELNPETAHELGVHENDLVRVVSAYGEVIVPVVIFPGIRPDVVAMPTGQGHEDSGRFAAGRGANVIDLIAAPKNPYTIHLPWASTRVRIEPTGEKRELARLENLHAEGRETIR